MELFAGWTIVGVVTETRELTSEKNKSWRGYVAKIASFGATFEVQLSAQQYGQVASGQHVRLEGGFEEQQGRQKLVVQKIMDGAARKGGAA